MCSAQPISNSWESKHLTPPPAIESYVHDFSSKKHHSERRVTSHSSPDPSNFRLLSVENHGNDGLSRRRTKGFSSGTVKTSTPLSTSESRGEIAASRRDTVWSQDTSLSKKD
ncbi:hypothetical protein J6590_062090 [Homalodisca vitripennis]|nr:hypothetical protein J6590_062090 [Homalodisca vitripennis]